jgi:hypothetical protein
MIKKAKAAVAITHLAQIELETSPSSEKRITKGKRRIQELLLHRS